MLHEQYPGINLLKSFLEAPNETLRDLDGDPVAIAAVLRAIYAIEEVFEDLLIRHKSGSYPDPEPAELWYIPETDAWGEPKEFQP